MIPARYTHILIDDLLLSGKSNAVSLESTIATHNTTRFQATGEAYEPALPSFAVSHSGFVDSIGAGDLEKEFYDRLGVDDSIYFAVLFATNQTDCPSYIAPLTWNQQFTLNFPFDGVVTASGNWPIGQGALLRGVRVVQDTFNTTGGSSDIDLGSAGSTGGTAYVFVQGITGSATNATIDLESSATGSFGGEEDSEGTATFSAVGVQVVPLSGTIGRYVRINVTSLGGSTDVTVTVIVVINGVTM